MYKRSLFIVTASAALLTGPALAQSASVLKEAVERAILKNPEIKLKYQNLMAVTNEQDAAKGGWRPRIDLETNAGRRNSLTPGMTSGLDYEHSDATLQLRQTLFDGFATDNEVRRLGYSRWASY